MCLDVIGMPVRAVRRVRHHDIGTLLAEVAGDARRGLIDRCGMEGAGILIAGRTGHPGVAVSEELLPVDAENLARSHQFRSADLAETRPDGSGIHVVNVAFLTSSCGEQDDANAVVMSTQHDTARRDAFIVGMRVNEEQCGHPETACAPAIDAGRWPKG